MSELFPITTILSVIRGEHLIINGSALKGKLNHDESVARSSLERIRTSPEDH
jgi:hypothetical protein